MNIVFRRALLLNDSVDATTAAWCYASYTLCCWMKSDCLSRSCIVSNG